MEPARLRAGESAATSSPTGLMAGRLQEAGSPRRPVDITLYGAASGALMLLL